MTKRIDPREIGGTGTRDATTFLRGDGTWATAGSGSGGGSAAALLATKVYNPTTNAVPALTTTDADIDATNLAITFTAPASGAVLVRATVVAICNSDSCYLTFRSGTSTIAGTRGRVLSLPSGTTQTRVTHEARVSGLTSGQSYTYKLGGFKGGAGTVSLAYGDDGTAVPLGPCVLTVWSA